MGRSIDYIVCDLRKGDKLEFKGGTIETIENIFLVYHEDNHPTFVTPIYRGIKFINDYGIYTEPFVIKQIRGKHIIKINGIEATKYKKV